MRYLSRPGYRRRRSLRLLWLPLVIVAAGMVSVAAPKGVPAQPQPSLQQQYVDLRKGTYQETDVLEQMPHAFPGLLAGFCAALLLAGIFGFYEMSWLTTLALVAVIGTIVYRFYWHPLSWHP